MQQMTITISEGNINIAGVPLEDLLQQVYQRGKEDALREEKSDMVTFQQLSKELAAKGRKIGVQTLTRKAREANVEVVAFDGKRLGCSRRSIKHFISNY